MLQFIIFPADSISHSFQFRISMDVTRDSLTALAFRTLATLLIWVLQELLRRCNLPDQWHPTELFSMQFSQDFSNEISVIHFDAPPVVPPQTATVATQTDDSADPPVPSPGTPDPFLMCFHKCSFPGCTYECLQVDDHQDHLCWAHRSQPSTKKHKKEH